MEKEINRETKEQLLEYLFNFTTPERRKKFEDVMEFRTKYFTVVLENIFQPHNTSAVLRSCDCFGIQDVHIIEDKNRFELNKDIALGSSKWLNICRYKQTGKATEICLNNLKEKGYTIVATSLHKDSVSIEELPVDKPIAIVFGTELTGLSDKAYDLADRYVKIPMYGFTESFNISVSAALTMFYLGDKIRKSSVHWQMNEDEQLSVMLQWVKNSVRASHSLEKKFLEEKGF